MPEADASELRIQLAGTYQNLLATLDAAYADTAAVDPEQLLRSANDKFSARFEKVQNYLIDQGKCIESASLEEMDAAWDAIKKLNK